jgi:5-methylcytosine-specific restriction endonuclease McrA
MQQEGIDVAVFVLDKQRRPLMPCTPKRARKLLAAGRARVHLLFPFCIRLVDRTVAQSMLQPLALKIDPGSVSTGIAVCRIEDVVDIDGVVEPLMHIQFLLELVHRGKAIQAALHARASMRRRRRSKNLRYRAPRFNNRTKPAGWLPPSLRHRIDTVMSQVNRLCRLAPITRLAQELVRFDMQLMQNAKIAGVEYQQGTLAGYEVREYLLEKFKRACAYCDAAGVPLQMEHIHPKAKGGSNRVSNLTLACGPCNIKKAARDIKEFLAKDPVRLARIEKQAKAPLRDASAVNATRWALHAALKNTGLPVATGTGGQTKWNRSRLGVIKTHALDAACVGVVHDVRGAHIPTLRVTCTGRGSRCKTRLNKYGFPRGYLTRKKTAFGFRTGDMVEAKVPSGKNRGLHQGRVAIRMTGNFNIQPGIEGVATVQGISHKHCRIMQRADGYGYVWQKTQPQQPRATSMAPRTTQKTASIATATEKATASAMSPPVLTGLKADVSPSKI